MAKSSARAVTPQAGLHNVVPSYADPESRLEAIIRLQAETSEARDEYLTSLLSEEATRSAMLDLIFQRKPSSQDDVEAHIRRAASNLGLDRQWAAGQELIREMKAKEREDVSKALTRYRQPAIEIE